MTLKLIKRVLMGTLASLCLTIGGADMLAQDFNSGANSNYTAGNTANSGVVRMKSTNGQITGKYGTATNPMPGTVIWICTNTMTIPSGTYYTNLGTDDTGPKTFQPGDIHVSGTYTPEGGDRTYTGTTFHFDGAGPGTQIIPGENTTNGTGFDDVVLSGNGPKQTEPNTTTVINGGLTHDGGDLTNQGNLVLGSDPSTSTGEIVNNVPSTGTGGITVGTGPLTVNDFTNTNGDLTIPSGSTVNVNGDFTYTAGNMAFDCESNFNYTGTGTQTIAATTGAGFTQYGNLGVSGGAKTAGGNVNVCNNYVASAELDMAPGTNNYTLTMLNTTNGNHATYTGGVEVRGNMQYNNLVAGTAYTYNNAGTNVTFETAPTTFAMNVLPNTPPNQLNDFQATTDINRKVNITYTGTGKISNIQTYWDAAEATSVQNIDRMRLAEGYDPAAARKKTIRVGATYAVDQTNRTVSYGIATSADGINLTANTTYADPASITSTREFLSGSDLVLSTAIQKVISVIAGRWSNPATWDGGVVPTAFDDVSVRTPVWTGVETAMFGGSAYAENEIDGSLNGDNGAAANSITIENIASAALYIGNQDPNQPRGTGNEVVFRTRDTGGTNMGIFNENTNANTQTNPETGNATGFNGLWIGTPTATYSPVLGGLTLVNNGAFTNNGILEVGICQ